MTPTDSNNRVSELWNSQEKQAKFAPRPNHENPLFGQYDEESNESSKQLNIQVKSSQSREVLIQAERSGAGRTGFKQTPAFLDLGTPRRRKGRSLQPPILNKR